MKIKIEQIKGILKEKVEKAIKEKQDEGFEIIGLFKFVHIDKEYSWRSKGKFISIRITNAQMGFENYTSKNIFYK